jgi:hypothetical protein
MAAKNDCLQLILHASSACVYNGDRQRDASVIALKEENDYSALPKDGYGWERLFSARMRPLLIEKSGIDTRISCYNDGFGLYGTCNGGLGKAPAAMCRKVIAAKLSGKHEIEMWGDGKRTAHPCTSTTT